MTVLPCPWCRAHEIGPVNGRELTWTCGSEAWLYKGDSRFDQSRACKKATRRRHWLAYIDGALSVFGAGPHGWLENKKRKRKR